MPRQDEPRRRFQYQERDRDAVRERANMKGGNFDSWVKGHVKQYKPRDGKNLIRILPPTWDKAKHYGYDLFVNYNIGADKQSYLSLHKMGKGDDPLHEAKRAADRAGDEAMSKALNPTQRIGVWLIDRLDEDEGPQFWAMPFTLDKAIANLSMDEDTKEVVFIDNPETGCDVRFYKEGAKRNTKYDASKMKLMPPGYISEDEKVQDEWLDYIAENPIPSILVFHDYEHINAQFNGVAGRDDDDEDGGERRGGGRGRGDSDRESRSSRGQSRDREDGESRQARGRARPEPEDNDPPADEPPAPRGRRREPEPDADPEPPRGRSRREPDPEPEAEQAPRSRRREPEPEPEAAPRRSRERPQVNAEDDEPPAPRGRSSGRRAEPEPEEPADEDVGTSIRNRLRGATSDATEERSTRRRRDPDDKIPF